MLVFRGGISSSSSSDERSCRNSAGVLDCTSLSFWPLFVSKNSKTSTAQCYSQCQLRPVCMWPSALCGCQHTQLAPWQDSGGRYRCVAQSCTMRGTLSRPVCWQVTVSDCLKYQSWHSSTLRHTRPTQCCDLALPRLTNNSCLQQDAMSALRTSWCAPVSASLMLTFTHTQVQ